MYLADVYFFPYRNYKVSDVLKLTSFVNYFNVDCFNSVNLSALISVPYSQLPVLYTHKFVKTC